MPLTPAEAYTIAANWGSYLRAGDPGSCFYGFYHNDGRPVSEAHRRDCLAYTNSLRAEVETKAAKRELDALHDFLRSCDLRPSADIAASV